MPRKRFKTEEIIQKLREAEVLLSQGRKMSLGLSGESSIWPPDTVGTDIAVLR